MGGKDIPDLLNADKHSLALRKKTDENKRKEYFKMNEIIQCLKDRRSVRKYKKEQVKEEQLTQILEAGTYAPTGMGMQSPIMVVVQDAETIAKLSKLNAAVMGVTSDPFYGASDRYCCAGRAESWHLRGGWQPCDGQSDECRVCGRRRFLLDSPCKRSVRIGGRKSAAGTVGH